MTETQYQYVIVGAGLAGGSAVQGIRELDPDGAILLLGKEHDLPYHRPPLTKQLWFGKKTVQQIFLMPEDYYRQQQVTVKLETEVVRIDAGEHQVVDQHGDTYRYEKLLLATGGCPRHLEIPGAETDGIAYYRYLSDYQRIRPEAQAGVSALVVGGSFIGSELAAALNMQGVHVTMLFPEPYLVSRIFPEGLGRELTSRYRAKGVTVVSDDTPASITRKDDQFVTQTHGGRQVISDLLLVGVGIYPAEELAKSAGLVVENGIVVDGYLQTADKDIFAAGDNALFPYQALGKQMRVEHWDNALNQGKQTGRNMAGAHETYDYMPYFYSDLFEFGYEAVGEINTKLASFIDWQQENDTGIIYYLRDDQLRGVMMCNIFGKVEAARELIRRGTRVKQPEELHGAITA